MHEFFPQKETVTAYLERFQLFISANSIEDDKVVATLLTVVGSKNYSLIRGLVLSPALPKDKMYAELVELLKRHYDPEPIVIAERFPSSTDVSKRRTSLLPITWPVCARWSVAANLKIFSRRPFDTD